MFPGESAPFWHPGFFAYQPETQHSQNKRGRATRIAQPVFVSRRFYFSDGLDGFTREKKMDSREVSLSWHPFFFVHQTKNSVKFLRVASYGRVARERTLDPIPDALLLA